MRTGNIIFYLYTVMYTMYTLYTMCNTRLGAPYRPGEGFGRFCPALAPVLDVTRVLEESRVLGGRSAPTVHHSRVLGAPLLADDHAAWPSARRPRRMPQSVVRARSATWHFRLRGADVATWRKPIGRSLYEGFWAVSHSHVRRAVRDASEAKLDGP